MYFKIVEGQ